MRSIQSVGEEILNLNPTKLYVFLGDDYGIKYHYLNKLRDAFKGDYTEISDVNTLLKMSNTKRIIPLKPQLYIIRYDSNFVSSLSEKNAKEIMSISIPGTVAFVYEDQKQCEKLSKYLPDICVRFDKVSTALIKKYLLRDFPQIPPSVIESIIAKCNDYSRCNIICEQLSNLSASELSEISDTTIWKTFNISNTYLQEQLKRAITYRDTSYLLRYLDSESDSSNILLLFMSTMVDIEKSLNNKFYNKHGDIREYWSFDDVYNMYDIAYRFLRMARFENITSNMVLYELVMLLRFIPTPKWEDIF